VANKIDSRIDAKFCPVVEVYASRFFLEGEGQLDPAKWDHVSLSHVVQDTRDWTDEKTGEVFPATFDFGFQLYAMRRSDEVHFYVVVKIPVEVKDWDQERQQKMLTSRFYSARVQMESYQECACLPGAPCPRHAQSFESSDAS